MALVAVGGVKLYRSSRSPTPSVAAASAPAPLPVPARENFDGYALPSDDARVKDNPTDLTVRRGCAWGVPGGNPYKSTVRQALSAARLPVEVTSKIGTMIERGIVSDRVVIARDSINTTSGKRRFDTTIPSMAFGKTVCFGTRVNFQAGHVEVADIYDATDATGTTVTVMVPYVCGNVSVLSERPHYYVHNGDHSVPEPAAAASLAAALAAGTATTAGARQEDALRGQRGEKLAAGRYRDHLVRVFVDLDRHVAGRDQLCPRKQDHGDEEQHRSHEHDHTGDDGGVQHVCSSDVDAAE